MEDKIRSSSIILSIAGLIDSLYLSWEKITQDPSLCIPGLGDCWTVNTSIYSKVMGIPVAYLGAGAYLAILIILLLEPRSRLFKQYGGLSVFGLSLVGTLFSAYLTYIELFVIKAICPFCVLSAVVMLALLVLNTVRVLKSEL